MMLPLDSGVTRVEHGVRTTRPDTGQVCEIACPRCEVPALIDNLHQWYGPHILAIPVQRIVVATGWEELP